MPKTISPPEADLRTRAVIANVTHPDGTPVPDDDPNNVYMEREWRVLGLVRLAVSDVSRITLPEEYAVRFRADMPSYCGQLTFAAAVL